jgi:hypothetical protein
MFACSLVVAFIAGVCFGTLMVLGIAEKELKPQKVAKKNQRQHRKSSLTTRL